MAGYAKLSDVLACPEADRHHWDGDDVDSDQGTMMGEELTCSKCGATAVLRWWGWDFEPSADEEPEELPRVIPGSMAQIAISRARRFRF
jgi:hypothetical protein